MPAYLALGSNLGDRPALLRRAIAELAAAPGVTLVKESAVYETDAISDEPQPPYLNAVVRVRTSLAPAALLALSLQVEQRIGRVRPVGKARAARTIDIDLLLYDDAILDQPGLCVPHPQLLGRSFVRIPLADVATVGLCHPATGTRLDVCNGDPKVRLYRP